MKLKNWEIKLAVALILFSLTVYSFKVNFIGDPQNSLNYFFNALGFLPLNIVLVTLVLNKLLSIRTRREKLEKMNMVLGMFFSEMGTHLLTYLSNHDPNLDRIKKELLVSDSWSDADFAQVETRIKGYDHEVNIKEIDLPSLHCWLGEKRGFLLRVLENPAMLEHESFTELLRTIFHLTDELELRKDFNSLPESDVLHLAIDINRVYGHLIKQWLPYMKHLKKNHPYLFSLAMRTNPFDENASPIVKK